MNLNLEQQKAVNCINWTLLILAWAWSWKTATLTARIENMIKNVWINPQDILAVTFTNKAAKEMKHRVSKVLWVEYNISPFKNRGLPMVWTFHSIWVFILKEKIESIWMNKDFVIYDESDKLSVIKGIIRDDLKLDEKKYPARSIASFISNAKNALISAKNYEKYVDSHIKEIVRDVYKIYQAKLEENNSLDFDDILVKTLEVLKNPEILEYYQEKYKYIMVDEYQDTNAPQYEIIKLLASKYRNLAVVGDDWQSIYSWRWADMRNILNFKKDYPEALTIKLEQNYRSTKHIINAANEVIKNNKTALDKTLFTHNEIWEKIIYIDALNDRIEASSIAKIIKEKFKSPPLTPPYQGGEQILPLTRGELEGGTWTYSDNLILYRTNSQSRSLEEALIFEWIPYKIIWWLKFYDRMEVKDILAYLRVIHNINDVVWIKRIINVPTRKIGDTTLKKIDEYRANFWVNYKQIFENIQEVDDLNSWAKRSVFGFYEILLVLIKESNNLVVSELIEYIIKKINYEEYLKDDITRDEFEAKIDNLAELKSVASTYNWMEPRESLSQFLEEVSLLTDNPSPLTPLPEGEGNIDNGFVTLMTIHTSKWLEYNRVFITGLEENLFPSFRSINEPKDLEEERRLMYVAMTRAKKELFISRSKERFQYGNYISNPVSRFIKEINPNYLEDYSFKNNFKNNYFQDNSTSKWSDFSFDNLVDNSTFKIKKTVIENDISDFNIWNKVSHLKFWNWTITWLSWDIAEINFWISWIKKMNIKIAPVRKI